ncbi:class I SAM-dependent methyltransferase [Dyadobacter luteus]|jgi:ubiquinone/menaquinone biosynthesis C-methylase UbiE|uniref:Class I SAM-dependent methyltransferase n=1 Tax=Dyadobacter luteus TaxID=2259619 RepID=A0A3D8Y924_9BACT|nr:class I SAM-dependent methyltransferase [Dyadobacter luteus]REA59760.1 class I SAM-dependent methyltransferase [Dyadobacter luteus]
MQKEWTENDLKEIASQLGNPNGQGGVKTGEMMNLSNNGMIATTIALLDIQDGQRILEIGPGNGKHVSTIFNSCEQLTYTGLDISETMVNEATQFNSSRVMEGKVTFVLSNGRLIPFMANSFDRIFTVNTIYFWNDPAGYAAEIYRVMKPGALFNLALADKSFMEKLPFTRYGFRLYGKPDVVTLLKNAGFEIEDVIEQLDITIGNMGQPVERDIIILKCRKN